MASSLGAEASLRRPRGCRSVGKIHVKESFARSPGMPGSNKRGMNGALLHYCGPGLHLGVLARQTRQSDHYSVRRTVRQAERSGCPPKGSGHSFLARRALFSGEACRAVTAGRPQRLGLARCVAGWQRPVYAYRRGTGLRHGMDPRSMPGRRVCDRIGGPQSEPTTPVVGTPLRPSAQPETLDGSLG